MRTWVKFTLAGVAIAVLGFSILAGTGAYYVFRHLDTTPATETDTLKAFDAQRARFGTRPPLIEIVDPLAADIRVNRSTHPQGLRASTIHVVSWNVEGERVQTDMPVWLMRFSSINILSKLGVAPDRFRLTVDDVVRYGPGIVVDFRQAGKNSVLVWVE
jgi:hypothetical protein